MRGPRGGDSVAAALAPGWSICHRAEGSRARPHRYVHRAWPTRAEALDELRALLAPYPRGSEWRRRLYVARWDGRRIVPDVAEAA